MSTRPSAIHPPTQRDAAFEQECVELFTGFLHVFGVPNSIGAIYGLLFASPDPLCFADIVERLDMSKGSVSQGLSFLRESGAIKIVSLPDDRKDYFVPELSLRNLLSQIIEGRLSVLIEETGMRIDRMGAAQALTPHQRSRLVQLDHWATQLSAATPALKLLLKVSEFGRTSSKTHARSK